MDISELKENIKRIEQSKDFGCSVFSNNTQDSNFSEIPFALDESKAFQRIVKLVSYSERSVVTVRNRLVEEGYEHDEIEIAISRALRTKLLDDNRFAENLIRKRIGAGKGLYRLRNELLEHDIDIDNVPYWQEIRFEHENDSEVVRAEQILDKSYFTAKNLHDAAYRKLLNRGFSSEVSSKAATNYCIKNGSK